MPLTGVLLGVHLLPGQSEADVVGRSNRQGSLLLSARTQSALHERRYLKSENLCRL